MASPLIARNAKELRQHLATLPGSIGFVPTMGALHAGHSALMEAAKKECGHVVASIFVNPAQFGPNEDFSRYPRTEAADIERLEKDECDLVFIPDAQSVYPSGFSTFVEVEKLSETLDGVHRPGHFRGVATVVSILLNLVHPQKAFFGEKDFQQLTIIRRLARDLAMPVEIVGVPTVREADGLALSSRNRYLSEQERATAPKLFRTLCMVREDIKKGRTIETSLQEAADWLLKSGFSKMDYLTACDIDTLQILNDNSSMKNARLLAAVWLGTTRLIDNIEI